MTRQGARERSGARRSRSARLGGRAGRSRRGLSAESARGDRSDARATSLGAVWSSCSPDFGVNGVLDRFGQIAPRVLFTADGYFYGGKSIDSLAPIAGVLRELPSVERVVVVPYRVARTRDASALPRAVGWEAVRPHRRSALVRPSAVRCTALHHVLLGHDGRAEMHRPRCGRNAAPAPARSTCCTPTCGPTTGCSIFTTCGWMMWNWLVSALAAGATIVLYEARHSGRTARCCGDWPNVSGSRCSAPARSTSPRSRRTAVAPIAD